MKHGSIQLWQRVKTNHWSSQIHTHTEGQGRKKNQLAQFINVILIILSVLSSQGGKKMLGRSVPMATQHSRLAVDLLEHHYGGFEGNQRPCFQEDTHIYTHTQPVWIETR